MVLYPSVYRNSSSELIFGYGIDGNWNTADGASGYYLTWNGTTMSGTTNAGIVSSTDNPFAGQIFKDASNAVYYASIDNHDGYNSEDIYVNSSRIVDIPSGKNGDQPWLLKKAGGVHLAYTSDEGSSIQLYYRTASTVGGLYSASSTRLSTKVVRAIDLGNATLSARRSRTLFAIEDANGDSHVVYQEATTNDIYRFYLDGHAAPVLTEKGVGNAASLDGIAVSWDPAAGGGSGAPILILSSHDASGVPVFFSIDSASF
ncbi:MAG: hypothetical protein Q8M76_04775 [Spirochaetaceae bacterium]|nr:hypothetical protein [Spirochaetaceae bacterium]